MLFRCILLASLGVAAFAQSTAPSTAQCRFKNGTALPIGGSWDWYKPCPGSFICCALNRKNPAGGDRTLGLTRDECLLNGLCQNRATERKVATQWVSPSIPLECFIFLST
ncbi:hypothetical protein SVAN01_10571 [Stagonosporopsis vannaccii]|nr:hypothetical protein SVAN01_10571 [Stagonosporopsis vannaccii]